MQKNETADLSACDREPIHIPGLIQPFGALLVLRPDDLQILQASDNLRDLLGMPAREAVGRPLDDLLGAECCARLREAVAGGELHSVSPTRILPVPPGARPCTMSYSAAGGQLLAEFEAADDDPTAAGVLQGELPFGAIGACETHEQLCRLLAREVRRFTGFDRCIVYRFDEDWHGMVIAEERNDVYSDSFLGHHFPASDIPAQARQLFTLNHFRIIPDTAYEPVPLTPAGPSPDMSFCTLRNVAPVHLEYLGNMGVRASLTMSLLCGDRLWGMITCHHASPRQVPVGMRLRCKALAELASYAVASIMRAEKARLGEERGRALRRAGEAMAAGAGFDEALQQAAPHMLEALSADTLLLRIGGREFAFGAALAPGAPGPLRAALEHSLQGMLTYSRQLSLLDPALADLAPMACGALYCRLGDAGDHLIAVRREVVEARRWAGDPHKPAEAEEGRLHPRKSFALWQEAVRGQSRRWSSVDADAALELRRQLLERREQIARKEFEGALRVERDRSSEILEAIGEGFVLVDRALRILRLNTEGMRLAQRQAGQPAGRALGDFCPQAFPAEVLQRCRQALAERAPQALEQQAGSAAAPLWLDIRIYPSADGLAIFFRDVSERKAMEAALRDINELLEVRVAARTAELERAHAQLHQSQKMEALGQLTGGIAHDFNNLLAGIVSSMELLNLRLRQGQTEGLGRYIDTATGATDRAAALIHRLLSFARQQTLRASAVDVNALSTGIRDLMQRAVGPAIRLELRLDGAPWPVLCDANQLENALLNLTINARDAMPEGGLLTLETRRLPLAGDEARELELAPGDYVAISVSDSGTGMPPEVAARAFDPFFTTKPVGKGTGLGLSTIYGFARQSGGQTRIRSVPGQGTTVSIILPRFHGDADDTALPVADGGPLQAALDADVLLVEDEPQLRSLLREMLFELGCRVTEADSGEAALAALEEGARVDLLVSDVGLPGRIDGWKLLSQARALRPQLQALLISGYGDAAMQAGRAPGPAPALLGKPFALQAFAARVTELLRQAPGGDNTLSRS
ncbi:ATP-binding protein [Noviherbaspirillum aridicola]|uniref:histidine kinase n=1 Tax=Noviherbaspirillum aridicola TaxID=2849687 RepID=A0ABQ4Q0H1_9BURK|nr:ATP-binding protein [Noviherbaspirillum aridicola]GIZ50497.1 hypothetical protein NCCP691_05110 [Noviherbaspirillum aridicola]